MKCAIMQPYFLPYIGYFQLINAVDTFVVYDNIKYTKKGWINRNRYLVNGKDMLLSIPLSKDSDELDIVDRKIAADFNKTKLFNQISQAYRKAPCFLPTISLFEKILFHDEENLFRFIFNSITQICIALEITTEMIVSSKIAIDHELKAEARVMAICHCLGFKSYVNPIGGRDLYSKDEFQKNGIGLQFIQSDYFEYEQFGAVFVPWLSILDILMFNDISAIKTLLQKYTLV